MKKLWFILITIAIVLGAFMLMPLKADAETEGVLTYTVSNGEATITDCDTSVSGDLVIPSTLGGYPVTSIGDSAFEGCSNLTSVSIPSSVTSIGDWAFYSCYRLTSVSIPSNITNIGSGAFYNCSSLPSINVDSNNAAYCSVDGVLFNKDKTLLMIYPTGKTATTYTIPDSVTSIGLYAFQGCNSLTSVTIPDSVTSIADSAFYNCSSLTSVTIPDSVTSIGIWAFGGCSSLTSITIPDSVTSIAGWAFWGCSGLTNIEIPDSVTNIGLYAFTGCSNLTSIEIPDSVTSIGGSAFEGCSSLTSIEIPDSVTSIGHFAFYECRSLTSVTIPDSVTSIGMDAFCGCSGLISVTICNGVTSIGDGAFYNCYNLTSVVIPDSVTSIGEGAFYYCSNLTTVCYKGTEDEWNKISIGSNNTYLLNAEIVFVQKSELEKALEGTDLTIGKLANESEFVIVPTPSGKVAMTGTALATKLNNDSISVVSNNGIIGTGSKLIIGEQEVEIAVKGDIDGDGIATVFDALMVKKALAENSFTENDIREFAGDIDGEGVTDSADVDAILAHIVGEMLIA